MMAVGLRGQALLCILGAVACIVMLYVAGIPYAIYQIQYGYLGSGPGETAFLVNYLLYGTVATALLGTALSFLNGRRLVGLFERLDRFSATAGVVLPALLALFVLITLVRLFLLRDTAITDDEHVYSFMAGLFASGRLYAPSPVEGIRAFFDNQFIINNGKWYGMYFPGHSALLAIGSWVGAQRWVPTASAVLTAWLSFASARLIFGKRVAILTLVLLVLSPYFVMSSATLLAHSTAALFLMTFLYFILRAQAPAANLLWWPMAGLALGWAGLTRPLAAAAFALPFVVWLALRLRSDYSRQKFWGTALFAVAGLAGLGVFCAYNVALTGRPFTTGYHTYSTLYWYPLDIGALKAPAPLPSIYEFGYTLERLNFWLFGWPLSLVLIPFFRRSSEALLVFLASTAVVTAYAVSTIPTINATGPAHYSELAAPLVMLSASGLEQLVQRGRNWTPAGDATVLGLVLAAVICAAVVFIPVYGKGLRATSLIARLPYTLVERPGLDRAIVFVHSLPSLQWSPGAWVYFHRNNQPDLSDRVLFVKDLGVRNQDLIRHFPDRTPYGMGVRGTDLLLVPLQADGVTPR